MNPLDKYTARLSTTGGMGEADLRYDWYEMEIFELHSIGSLVFDRVKPLKLDISVSVNIKTNISETANACFDFGLDYKIPLLKENNFLYDYAGLNDGLDPMKTVFAVIKFDLMHAFFHYDGDPNYTHLHWALRGMLKDRAFVTEHECDE